MGNIETKEKPKHIVKVPCKICKKWQPIESVSTCDICNGRICDDCEQEYLIALKYEDVCKLCYKNTNVE